MTVEVNQIVDNELYINNKHVYLDTNGNWVTREELTVNENSVLQKHIISLNKSEHHENN